MNENFEKMRRQILAKRYLLKDPAGNIIETESQMYRRVANAIASQEQVYGMSIEKIASLKEQFYQMMKNHRFLPNSPTLMNAGKENVMLSACFVLPNWKYSIWNSKHSRLMANDNVTTIAPTGTISLIAGCNGGIEPFFEIVSKRKALDGKEFIQLQPTIEKLGREQGWLTDTVIEKLKEGASIKDISEIPNEVKSLMVTAHEIAPKWHIKIQAAFQKHVDNAVSKTVNLPGDATIQDVDQIYRQAYELNCKGITVYRNGIRCLSTISRRKHNKNINVLSCPDAIARAIEENLGINSNETQILSVNPCPECSQPLRRESGCNVCDKCGYTKCG